MLKDLDWFGISKALIKDDPIENYWSNEARKLCRACGPEFRKLCDDNGTKFSLENFRDYLSRVLVDPDSKTKASIHSYLIDSVSQAFDDQKIINVFEH